MPQADCHVCADAEMKKKGGGSTATIALLHSLDLPYSHPYYASSLLSLTVAHLGDTSCLLASTQSGRARRLTESHHADSRTESERLRTSGTGIITDSFGESRWGGVVANTRAVGDVEFKPVGVIAEPDITKKVFKGARRHCSQLHVKPSRHLRKRLTSGEYLPHRRRVLAPDPALGRHHRFPLGPRDCRLDPRDPRPDPSREKDCLVRRGRRRVRRLSPAVPLTFISALGGNADSLAVFMSDALTYSEDNLTCLVVPLPGFGRMGGIDTTASRREYRLRQMTGASSRQKRM